MKKIYYILSLLSIFGLFSCENEMEVYSAPENRLNFVYNGDFSILDTLVSRTFVYEVETKVLDTIWMEVETMGFLEDRDRPFVLVQAKRGNGEQAVAGKHYIAFDDPLVSEHYKIPAGKSKVQFPVVLKRDPSLKEHEVTLCVRIGNNENFISGYEVNQEKVIVVADIWVQPQYWTFLASYYFAGKYGKVKHQFMINATAGMGVKMNDDFFYSLVGDPSNVDMSLTDYWFNFFTRKLAEENATRAAQGLGPLREAPEAGETEGALVKFTQYEF